MKKKFIFTLELKHDKYLDFMVFMTGLNRSQLVQDIIESDIEKNYELIQKHKDLFN
jgi:hypothetical protein